MNEFQSKCYELLKEFVKFCDEHDLTYYLIGGSALGAVRHKGIIPWDDDIDVALPRKDFDRFVELGSNHFTKDIFLQTYKTDKNYMFNFVKLRDSNTTFIEGQYKFCDMNHGIWLDIFPLDGVESKSDGGLDLKKTKHRINKIWITWVPAFCKSQLRHIRKKHFFRDLFVDIGCGIISIFNHKNHALDRIEKQMRKVSFEDAIYVSNLEGAWKEKEVVKKAYFGKGIKMQFEDIMVRIPENYDEYLTSLYGDYMTPPPVEKRPSHHNVACEDINSSYKEHFLKY